MFAVGCVVWIVWATVPMTINYRAQLRFAQCYRCLHLDTLRTSADLIERELAEGKWFPFGSMGMATYLLDRLKEPQTDPQLEAARRRANVGYGIMIVGIMLGAPIPFIFQRFG